MFAFVLRGETGAQNALGQVTLRNTTRCCQQTIAEFAVSHVEQCK
jgi:hypothetical protein